MEPSMPLESPRMQPQHPEVEERNHDAGVRRTMRVGKGT